MITPLTSISVENVIPTVADVSKIYSSMLRFQKAQKTPEKDAWNKSHFRDTPWGIAYLCSKASHEKSVASASRKSSKAPVPKNDVALKSFLISVLLGWDELTAQLKRALINWGYTKEEMELISKEFWSKPENANKILKAISDCIAATDASVLEQVEQNLKTFLNEAVEKHKTLNTKLFTKEELLKDKVHDKMLEIVDEFLNDLKEQDIQIKVDDILLIGSNASYNYTKDSDIDLHIIANTKSTKYAPEVATALYSAYRSLFNKQLDIKLFDIPLEIFVETEESNRVSNGIYSVKKNKWIKKPVQEDIPEYDKEAIAKLVDVWEAKYKAVLDEIKADKLKDEKKVVKLLEDIYNKLRKKGIAKGEYSEENLAFKELRNKGYLDKLKEFKNELVSKRLSLEEKLDRQSRMDVYAALAQAARTQPVIQDNGMFFIYNLKASEVNQALSAIKALPFVVEAHANENGKYDFSNTLDLAMNKMPKKYYNIRGTISM